MRYEMNIFENIPGEISEAVIGEISKEISKEIPGEIIEELHKGSNVRIERIVSSGNVSPDGFWYDQEEDEWVLLITGTAVLAFEDNRTVELKAGDTLFIGAHEKHRIINTSSDPKCIWICVFMKC